MPLIPDAARLIRENLAQAQTGMKPRPVVIGTLTAMQLSALNAVRSGRRLEPMKGEVVFVGGHIYNSRIVADGYTIDDVIAQITSAMEVTAVIKASPKMTALVSQTYRDDGYGNRVIDQAVLECSAKFPHPELYSVIPKGDQLKPKRGK